MLFEYFSIEPVPITLIHPPSSSSLFDPSTPSLTPQLFVSLAILHPLLSWSIRLPSQIQTHSAVYHTKKEHCIVEKIYFILISK